MVVEFGGNFSPNIDVNDSNLSHDGSVSTWEPRAEKRVTSETKQVDFTVYNGLHALVFLQGILKQLRLVDNTASLVPLSGERSKYGLLSEIADPKQVTAEFVQQYLHGVFVIEGNKVPGENQGGSDRMVGTIQIHGQASYRQIQGGSDRMVGTIQIHGQASYRQILQNKRFLHYLKGNNEMSSKILLERCELPGSFRDRVHVGKFINVIAREDLSLHFAQFLREKLNIQGKVFPEFAVKPTYTLQNSRSYSVFTRSTRDLEKLQDLLVSVFPEVTLKEILFVPHKQWRSEILLEERMTAMKVQYIFSDTHQACVVSGIKSLGWITQSQTTFQTWMHALTASNGAKLFTKVFEPVHGKMVLYFRQSVAREVKQWRRTALIEIAQLLCPESLTDQQLMSSIFIDPDLVSQRLVGFSGELQRDEGRRYAQQLSLLGLEPEANVPRSQRGFRGRRPGKGKAIQYSAVIPEDFRRRNQRSRPTPQTSALSSSTGDSTTLSTKLTESSKSTIHTDTVSAEICTAGSTMKLPPPSAARVSTHERVVLTDWGAESEEESDIAAEADSNPAVPASAADGLVVTPVTFPTLATIAFPGQTLASRIKTMERTAHSVLPPALRNLHVLKPRSKTLDITLHPDFQVIQKQRDRDRETLRKTAELADLAKAKYDAEVEKNAAERAEQARMQVALQLANEELNRKLKDLQVQAEGKNLGTQTLVPVQETERPPVTEVVEDLSEFQTASPARKKKSKRTRSPRKVSTTTKVNHSAAHTHNSYSCLQANDASIDQTMSEATESAPALDTDMVIGEEDTVQITAPVKSSMVLMVGVEITQHEISGPPDDIREPVKSMLAADTNPPPALPTVMPPAMLLGSPRETLPTVDSATLPATVPGQELLPRASSLAAHLVAYQQALPAIPSTAKPASSPESKAVHPKLASSSLQLASLLGPPEAKVTNVKTVQTVVSPSGKTEFPIVGADEAQIKRVATGIAGDQGDVVMQDSADSHSNIRTMVASAATDWEFNDDEFNDEFDDESMFLTPQDIAENLASLKSLEHTGKADTSMEDDNDSVSDAIEGVKQLQVDTAPATGSNGGGLV